MILVYHIARHGDGWAYRLDDTWSEEFASHKTAFAAAKSAALRHRLSGRDAHIEFEDKEGVWHREVIFADDRPETTVADE
ncbi:hypothetical protein GA0061102_10154 [Rhizobium miluonense]|uniref:DUF2188 domain-containing protein n=1 Tax=Rhizobium miluonense TaxID=411945 RepID=A0A1C3VLQ7_9HYPH|nr:hypothetical protein GA0061102_10154 [Rhizobium miluonense]